MLVDLKIWPVFIRKNKSAMDGSTSCVVPSPRCISEFFNPQLSHVFSELSTLFFLRTLPPRIVRTRCYRGGTRIVIFSLRSG